MSNPQFWRLRKQNYRLLGEVCNRCGTCMLVCPPKVDAVEKRSPVKVGAS